MSEYIISGIQQIGAGIPDLTTRQNPLGPFSLAEGFRTAMHQWAGDLGVRLVVFKLFDRYVMGYVGGLYDDLNDTLSKQGFRRGKDPLAGRRLFICCDSHVHHLCEHDHITGRDAPRQDQK